MTSGPVNNIDSYSPPPMPAYDGNASYQAVTVKAIQDRSCLRCERVKKGASSEHLGVYVGRKPIISPYNSSGIVVGGTRITKDDADHGGVGQPGSLHIIGGHPTGVRGGRVRPHNDPLPGGVYSTKDEDWENY